MFVRRKGKTVFRWYPWQASSGAIAEGAVCGISGGYLVVATNTVKAEVCVGVIRHAIAATDANYAVDHMVEVEVPVEKWVVWEAPVTVGTLATTSVGGYFDLTTADTGDAVDQSASTENIVFCTKFLTAAKGEFVLNIGPESRGDLD